ncbi:hypothetical protein ACU686_29220 [Yinghuangia aomiensis]
MGRRRVPRRRAARHHRRPPRPPRLRPRRRPTRRRRGQPLVVVVRDLHRNISAADLLAGIVAARPDTVVVEMGLPYGDAQD